MRRCAHGIVADRRAAGAGHGRGVVDAFKFALIGAAYTGSARGPAIGTWAAAGALTTALGPPLGGWLVDTVGWRAIFFINPPLAAAALMLGLRLPVDRAIRSDPLDTRGAGLARSRSRPRATG